MDGCCLNIQRLPEVQHGSQLYIFWRTEVWLPAHTFRHMHHNTLAWFFGQWFFQYYVILRTIQYTVRKEMKCSEDSQIIHEIVRDTSLICSCFYDFRVVSRTISCSISESPPTLYFLFNSDRELWWIRTRSCCLSSQEYYQEARHQHIFICLSASKLYSFQQISLTVNKTFWPMICTQKSCTPTLYSHDQHKYFSFLI